MKNKTFQEYILNEMPQYYSGAIIYQKENKFNPISVRNISDYILLGELNGFLFVVHPQQTGGFVINGSDLDNNTQKIIPAMHLSLRDTNIKGYKQAHHLRIQEKYSKMNLTSKWYDLYINKFGGIVSDLEHLEGGKTLWWSFIKNIKDSPMFNISLVDKETGDIIIDKVTEETPQDAIWSKDATHKNKVLVYEKLGRNSNNLK